MSCDPALEAARGAAELLRSIKPRRLGLGTGSTLKKLLPLIDWDPLVVSSSMDTALAARSSSLRVAYPITEIDAYVDGADEVDMRGVMIKGGGGAMLGEKILANFSPLNIFMVSEKKLVDIVGRRPLPIEVVKEYVWIVIEMMRAAGFRAEIRRGEGKMGPVVTDWGGIVVDVHTGPIEEPEALDARLKRIPGVVETGLFYGLTDHLIIGFESCGYRVISFGRRKS